MEWVPSYFSWLPAQSRHRFGFGWLAEPGPMPVFVTDDDTEEGRR